jgi:hypothetical protein
MNEIALLAYLCSGPIEPVHVISAKEKPQPRDAAYGLAADLVH